MASSVQRNIKEFITVELERSDYKIYRDFEIREYDLSFDVLAESSNKRVIFLIEYTSRNNLPNTLAEINTDIEGLRQFFALKSHNRMIFLILILEITDNYALELIEDFKAEKSSYHKIVINTKEVDMSTTYSKWFLRSILPITSFSLPKKDGASEIVTERNIEEFASKYPFLKTFFPYMSQKHPEIKSIIKILLRESQFEIE